MTIVALICRYARDERAAAAVEFTLIMPLLVLLLFGGIDVTQAVSANRKLSNTAATLSDLVAQNAKITKSQVSNVFVAGSAVLTPFDAARLQALITNVVVDGTGNARVDWSQGLHKPALSRGATYTIPSSLAAEYRKPNTSFIVTEVAYEYNPVVGYALIGPVRMAGSSYALPRSASLRTGVPCTDCL
jgi:Flp pilus assembly protein TadG